MTDWVFLAFGIYIAVLFYLLGWRHSRDYHQSKKEQQNG